MTTYYMCGDGNHLLHTGPVSDRDRAEERHAAALAEEQHRAAQTVAAHARDAEDCQALASDAGAAGRRRGPAADVPFVPIDLAANILALPALALGDLGGRSLHHHCVRPLAGGSPRYAPARRLQFRHAATNSDTS